MCIGISMNTIYIVTLSNYKLTTDGTMISKWVFLSFLWFIIQFYSWSSSLIHFQKYNQTIYIYYQVFNFLMLRSLTYHSLLTVLT